MTGVQTCALPIFTPQEWVRIKHKYHVSNEKIARSYSNLPLLHAMGFSLLDTAKMRTALREVNSTRNLTIKKYKSIMVKHGITPRRNPNYAQLSKEIDKIYLKGIISKSDKDLRLFKSMALLSAIFIGGAGVMPTVTKIVGRVFGAGVGLVSANNYLKDPTLENLGEVIFYAGVPTGVMIYKTMGKLGVGFRPIVKNVGLMLEAFTKKKANNLRYIKKLSKKKNLKIVKETISLLRQQNKELIKAIKELKSYQKDKAIFKPRDFNPRQFAKKMARLENRRADLYHVSGKIGRAHV